MPDLKKGDYALTEQGALLVEIEALIGAERAICKILSGVSRGSNRGIDLKDLEWIDKSDDAVLEFN
ncbi:hypothetical protein EZI45_19020 [Delftia tsuruhatensis]|uniref:hypothetical protein n=1 Tax=Delftia tsuruhatensis TaxID=180282 RepID=UPI0010567AC7|nr:MULTISPECIES: hypothetical protein [Delftia]MCX7504535.1 hypothetical protein [Delftia tsuruhatensis]TDF26213.1 hypothetical protein EZI45_19020 [Delftia tsuruhatensis]